MQDFFDRILEIAREFMDREDELPPFRSPTQLHQQLDLKLHPEGRGVDEVLDNLRDVMMATPSSSSRRFLNQLFGGREPVAVGAEMLAAIANTSMYTYKAGAVQVIIENEIIRRLAELVGYESYEGIFTPGGSLSNFAAMLMARNETVHQARNDGLPGTRLAIYTSDVSHYSIPKAAVMLGLGRNNVRTVGTDAIGRMDPGELEEMIRTDKAEGVIPIMINATGGTTVEGSFDPLTEIARVAREQNVWLHVDGAYGGSVLFSRSGRHLLEGLEYADSFSIDAHKLLAMPLICSIVLSKHTGVFTRNLDENASYLFQQDSSDLNPGTRSLQCGRRNDALKLWAAWQHKGDEGFGRRVDRLFELAQYAARVIRDDPNMTLTFEPQSFNVCFEVDGCNSVRICETLDREGRFKVGYAIVKDRKVIRLVCVNADLTERDLDLFFDAVRDVAVAMTAGR